MDHDLYDDRQDAGGQLATLLAGYGGVDGLLVLGLPRGGVPVAAEVAKALGAELDVLIVRKIGFPANPEVAMGAIASIAGAIEIVRNRGVLEHGRRWAEIFTAEATAQEAELRRRQAAYRAQLPQLSVAGRVVVLVDDGMATGATMRAAAAAVRRAGPKRLVVAVPVGLPGSLEGLPGLADEVVCAWTPASFLAVGQAYRVFDQTTDEEVRRILAGLRNRDSG
ncbi:MAG: phosphoribosyltransferase [Microbacteriaceae bacterium]